MSAPSAINPPHAQAAASPMAPQPQHGLFHDLRKWCGAMVDYLQLRIQLALMEARDAGSRYAVIAGLFAGALILALMGYLLLILTAIFALASWMDGPHVWLKILGGATALHIVLAVILVQLARARLKAGIFEKTKEEFRKDQQWHTTPVPPEAPKT